MFKDYNIIAYIKEIIKKKSKNPKNEVELRDYCINNLNVTTIL